MTKLFAIIGCALLLALSGCGSSGHSGQAQASDTDNVPKKTVFDGYVNDVKKAKQVQGKLKAAQKKMGAQLNKIEGAGAGDKSGSGQ